MPLHLPSLSQPLRVFLGYEVHRVLAIVHLLLQKLVVVRELRAHSLDHLLSSGLEFCASVFVVPAVFDRRFDVRFQLFTASAACKDESLTVGSSGTSNEAQGILYVMSDLVDAIVVDRSLIRGRRL